MSHTTQKNAHTHTHTDRRTDALLTAFSEVDGVGQMVYLGKVWLRNTQENG